MRRPEDEDETPNRPDPDLDDEYGEWDDDAEDTELDEQPDIGGTN